MTQGTPWTVSQEDREAAAVFAEATLEGWCNIGGNDVAAIRNGIWDDDDTDLGQIVQAFAKHRHEAQAAFEAYLNSALEGFANDPADSDFQRGYEAALRETLQVLLSSPGAGA